MNDVPAALPRGLPIPAPENDGLSAPYWNGLAKGRLLVQRCGACATWQWGPEWICHACLSFDIGWHEVQASGRVYVAERVWHPVHPALKGATPYQAVLVELPHAGSIRMLGNLLEDRPGSAAQPVAIGTQVCGVFEHHLQGQRPYSLLNWRRA